MSTVYVVESVLSDAVWWPLNQLSRAKEARPGRDHHLAGLLFLRVARV